RQIAQPGMNMGQDRQMQMVRGNGGNQFRQYAGQNAGNMTGYNDNGLIGVQGNGNQNRIGNGNLVAARAEGNAAGQNGNQIRCYNCRGLGIQLQAEEFDLMAAAVDLDEIKEANENCILMANLQQASTSGTQTDSAPIYDSDGSAEVHENCDNNEIFNMFTQEEQYTQLLEPIPESHQVPHNDNNVISEDTSVEQGGKIVEQHLVNFEETRALYDSLYQNLAIEVEKVNSVNRKLKEPNADLTTELARFKNQTRCFEISQEKYDKLERCYQQSVYQEQCLSKKINALHLSTDPTTAMNMALALMAKAFKVNNSSPTNYNQRISSNPRNRQIAQPGMNMGQDRQMQMVIGNGGNQFRQYAGQNAGNMTGYNDVIGNQNRIGNGNLVAGRAEGNAAGQNGNQISTRNVPTFKYKFPLS
nr:hypothetical protein [Tanacetum cinerariifolium]